MRRRTWRQPLERRSEVEVGAAEEVQIHNIQMLDFKEQEGRMERTCRMNEGGAVGEVEEVEAHEEAVDAMRDEEERMNRIMLSTPIISR